MLRRNLQKINNNTNMSILDMPLIGFPSRTGASDIWRVKDACEGTQVFGATGSGKTSGSGQTIAKSFLATGFGGLVLCAKIDECALWENYARECGREEDLIIFRPDSGYRFNPLQYEYQRKGKGAGQTEAIVQLFAEMLNIANQADSGKQTGGDPFWTHSTLYMLRNAIDILAVSVGYVGLNEIQEIIASAPQTRDEVDNSEWQQLSALFQLIQLGRAKLEEQSSIHQRDFKLSEAYWLQEFPSIAQKTRSSIIATFKGMSDALNRGLMYEMLCTDITITPEQTYQEGKIIILDLPIKEYGQPGLVVQGIIKLLWQQAVERRNVEEYPRPVFLWADESQFFVSRYDQLFQTTARSSRACTVYLTQNINNYYSMMGGGETQVKSTVDSLMGSFQTRIFHRNGDSVTNTWASEQIGKGWKILMGTSQSSTDGQQESSNTGSSTNQSLNYEVEPSEFLRLANGSDEHDYIVEAILLKAGREFHETGQPHRLIELSQKV